MKTKTLTIIAVIALLILGIWYFSGNKKIECNAQEDCNKISKCQSIECTCYKNKCETGYISVPESETPEAEENRNLQTSDDTFTALDESVELLE
ncbi:MAG: hypothetical protein AABX65_01865 [Nanoarchaeota archaeon]